MSALISALDKHTPTQTGENGHSEYTWSNDLQELIVQFHFQVVRTNADGVSALSIKLNDILYRLYTKLSEYNNWDKNNKCSPCPPCGRCPEPSFECVKRPTYQADNPYLPMPVLADFSQFGM